MAVGLIVFVSLPTTHYSLPAISRQNSSFLIPHSSLVIPQQKEMKEKTLINSADRVLS